MRRGIRLPTVLLFALAVFYVGLLLMSPERPPRDATPIDRLLGLMHQRLVLMHDVARWKWNQKQAIADPAREQTFLDAIEARAKDKGLDPAWVGRFFRAQIEAAKLVQQTDFETWKAEQRGAFDSVPDLQKELRPRIDELSQELLDALAAAKPALQRERGTIAERARTIMGDLPADVRQTAAAPLTDP